MQNFDYAFLIATIRNNFNKSKEQIILNHNVFTNKWTVCDQNRGSIAGIDIEFVMHLNDLIHFEIGTIDRLFLNIKSTMVGNDLIEFLQCRQELRLQNQDF